MSSRNTIKEYQLVEICMENTFNKKKRINYFSCTLKWFGWLQREEVRNEAFDQFSPSTLPFLFIVSNANKSTLMYPKVPNPSFFFPDHASTFSSSLLLLLLFGGAQTHSHDTVDCTNPRPVYGSPYLFILFSFFSLFLDICISFCVFFLDLYICSWICVFIASICIFMVFLPIWGFQCRTIRRLCGARGEVEYCHPPRWGRGKVGGATLSNRAGSTMKHKIIYSNIQSP